MAYVSVPKDLTKVKNKVAYRGNLFSGDSRRRGILCIGRLPYQCKGQQNLWYGKKRNQRISNYSVETQRILKKKRGIRI